MEWSARRVLRELCTTEMRKEILVNFWKRGDDASRRIAAAHLAKSLHFRDESIRKLPAEKKAELMASRLGAPELEEVFEAALLAFHVLNRAELMGAFLDLWGIRHKDGSIEEDDYSVPGRDKVDEAIDALKDRFPMDEMLLYVVTAGLVMGEGMPAWREATWPAAEARLGSSAS